MNIKPTITGLLAVWLSVTLLQACATGPNAWMRPAKSEAIALDFVNHIARIEALRPDSTTIQMRRNQGRFGRTLKRGLKRRGYFIQTIPDHFVAPMLVSYQATFSEQGSTKEVSYRVRVGGMELEQVYALNKAGRWQPRSAIELAGVPISSEPLGDTLVVGADSTIERPVRVTKAKESRAEASDSRAPDSVAEPLKVPESDEDGTARYQKINAPPDRALRIRTHDENSEKAGITESESQTEKTKSDSGEFKKSIAALLLELEPADEPDVEGNAFRQSILALELDGAPAEDATDPAQATR